MRQRSRMSQKELAERIGTTQSVVSRMESSNYVDYRVSTLKRIADATGGSFVISATR
ncbi:MAG: helix-turn-helix transcriptional regulator [Elusimicrobia bacterium]|nr:helix-turn-helix transcriptional regulator [Elusimicrobiota bacterium]